MAQVQVGVEMLGEPRELCNFCSGEHGIVSDASELLPSVLGDDP